MQSAVDRVLNENFNIDNHSLEFFPPVVEVMVNEGSVYEGSFMIYGPSNVPVQGIISSTSLKVENLVDTFSGSESQIPFRVDSTGLSIKDSFKGEFRVISNQGEYQVPFDIRIDSSIDTSLGDIKNLFHFTNLARTNWDEAVSLFNSDEFEHILGGADAKYIGIYRALKVGENSNQNLEEFLLAINKKQPAEYIPDDANIRIDGSLNDNDRYIMINKNGWGYSDLRITTEADFIELDRNVLDNSDFDSNVARFIYRLIPDRLHAGKNYARVHFKNAYNDFYVSICVIKNSFNRKIVKMQMATKHLTVDLMHYYEAFRCKKISATTWISKTNAIVDSLMENDPENLEYILYHVQLLITGDRVNEAKWLLEKNEDNPVLDEDVTLYCYYLYLTTLIDRSDRHIDEVCDEVFKAHQQCRDNWRISWLLIYLSEDYAKSLPDKWELLKEQFKYGCTSPILYSEAYQVLVNNPTIMTVLSSFEIQVLRFMARNEILTLEVINQFLYLLNNIKYYDSNMLGLLSKFYEVNPDNEVLKAICILLINTGRTDKKAFEWYSQAVKYNLRITKLYEYYMMSIDMSENIEIPKIVLMYFALDSSLSVMRNSYLYAYVYRSKVIYPELYDSYRENLERFVMFQVLAGNNNEYLAYLYKNILTETKITQDVSKGLVKALFMCAIKPKRTDIHSIYVKYLNIDMEQSYRITDEVTYIPLYGDNYEIILEDEAKNRFVRPEEYELTRLMRPDDFVKYIEGQVEDEILFDLYLCENGRDIHSLTKENVDGMRRISQSPIVSEWLRKDIKSNLFRFYYDEDMMDDLDSLLTEIEIAEVTNNSITDIIHYMVLRGMYEKAYRWICYCGGENIDIKVIVRLCQRLLQTEDFSKDEEDVTMTALIYRAFMFGKYEDTLLKYLVKYFNGTSKEMREVWKVCCDRGVPCDEIESRILEQMLYTNAFVPGVINLFLKYSKRFTYNRLALAFLAQICYDYFANDKITDDKYFEELQRYIDLNQDIPFVCKLAYTKFYSDKVNAVDENVSRTIVIFLKDIVSRGMYFGYFKEYSKAITYMHRFLDKTMVEYRVKPGCTATIHYMVESNGGEDNEYTKEVMHEMYHGICVKQFVLFFGERLQYYIVEHNGEEETVTESGTLSNNDMEQTESNSRYSMINDISISRTLGDYGTMDELLFEYFQKEYFLGKLFNAND